MRIYIYIRMCTLVERSTKVSPTSPKQHRIRKLLCKVANRASSTS